MPDAGKMFGVLALMRGLAEASLVRHILSSMMATVALAIMIGLHYGNGHKRRFSSP